jgi:TonB family protein
MHESTSNTAPETAGTGESHDPHVSVHLRDTPEVPFLLYGSQARMGRALGTSVALHLVAIAAFIGIALALPDPMPLQALNDQPDYDIVWIPQEGPGGGGGGGGNQSIEPPRQVELPGQDKRTLPVTKPVTIEPIQPPKPQAVEAPPVELSIPAMAMAQGQVPVIGTLEGLPDGSSTSQGSGSGGGAGTGRGTGIGPGTGSGLGPGSGGGTGGGVYRPGSGVSTPRIVREVKPQYTPDALRAKIQGEVWLDCVVLASGDVGSCDVVRSLDSVFGLDQEAIKAAKQWRFSPGTRQGVPVPVLVTISMGFTLR